MPHTVTLVLNQQQLELLDRTIAAGAAADRVGLVLRALREFGTAAAQAAPATVEPEPGAVEGPAERRLLREHVMQPGTGKALEIMAGEILRIELFRGPQCVDFNCFNLHDYKEAMHAGRIRAVHGLKPSAGSFVWSAPPRERAMMYVLADTVGENDVMFARCSAYLYESVYGFAAHANCHDIQAEAQREYGLTPDDVHDSLNFFMSTGVQGDRAVIRRLPAKTGDHVELMALIDVLAVPNVCGNDVGRTSNFELKPVKLSVLKASRDDLARVPRLRTYPTNLRGPHSFRQPMIKADRPLKRDPEYRPEFADAPLRVARIDVPLDEGDRRRLAERGKELEAFYGADEGAVLRDVLLSWWETRFAGSLPGTAK